MSGVSIIILAGRGLTFLFEVGRDLMVTRRRFIPQSPFAIALFVGMATLFTGYVDYVTGPHVSISAFYLLPLGLAAWNLGLVAALTVAFASVALWATGNTINGDVDFLNPVLGLWNGGVQLASYAVVAFTVSWARDMRQNLEDRVQERTAELQAAQVDLLRVSEEEQRRIGQELHDGLCQHLAGAAFTCHALQEELAKKHPLDARLARQLGVLINEAIRLSRQSAKGLDPVALSAEGLMQALEDFATTTTNLFHVTCHFSCDSPVPIQNASVATHLFRIAQEATRNAITHGHAANINITLDTTEEGLELTVADDGKGIGTSEPPQTGMGLKIMRRRAAVIGSHIEVTSGQNGGTLVRVVLPRAAPARSRLRA